MDELIIAPASKDFYFFDPDEYPPPPNTKLLILTTGNTCVIGSWSELDSEGWAYLPKVPLSIRNKRKRNAAERPHKQG